MGRDLDPKLELWDQLDPLDDRELLSDELQAGNTIKRKTTLDKIKQFCHLFCVGMRRGLLLQRTVGGWN
jgi:hypothetical protein